MKEAMPGRLEEIMNFLKMYRTADGGAENHFVWGGEVQPLVRHHLRNTTDYIRHNRAHLLMRSARCA